MLAILLALAIAPFVHAYSILGVFPSRDRSNFLAYGTFFRELASRGHSATLVGNFPMSDAPATYREILLSRNAPQRALSFDSVIASDIARVPFETLVSTKVGNEECRTLMDNAEILELVRTSAKFDVIIVESLNSDCGFALAHNLSSPFVAFLPQSLQPWQYSRLGITFNAAYVPLSGVSYGRHPWFLERVASSVLYQVVAWTHYVASQVTDRVFLYRHFGDELPAMEGMAAGASVTLVNTHPAVFGGVVRPDNVVDIGGIHLRTPRVLPTEIERFITEAERGAVYVSLGSAVLEATLPREKLDQLVQFFAELRLRVLWKWDPAAVQDATLPRNVLARKWMPQYDILRHSNVLAFISHCGLLSATEAAAAGVPVICVPLFGDQHGNAAALRDSGLATVLEYEDLSNARLHDAMNEVLEPSLQKRAKQVAKIFHDRPMSPLETAVYWTEYVARHRGAAHLLPTSVGVPAYQRHQLDVLLFLATVAAVLLYVFVKLLSVVCCWRSGEDVEYGPRSKRVKFE